MPIKFSLTHPTEATAAAIIACKPPGISADLAAAYAQLLRQALVAAGHWHNHPLDALEEVRQAYPCSLQIVLNAALFGHVPDSAVRDFYIPLDGISSANGKSIES